MKRVGNLWHRLVSPQNLLRAATKARRGKRFVPSVARFWYQLEHELSRLQDDLTAKTYRPGGYRTFYVYEPKKRLISAAAFRDRVVHHALTRILEPIFEPTFIFDSYACRRGKGTHAAARRCQQFARRYRYVLKADVQKYFPSIDHEILKSLLARKVKDCDVLRLAGLIIDHSNPQEPVWQRFPGDDLFTAVERRRGLPIGNQSSQFFANVYLDPLDHFVRDQLRAAGYVRYVDDFLVFFNDKRELARMRSAIAVFLERLRLKLHPAKSVIFPVVQGIPFLGCRVLPTHCLLAKANVRRFRRRAAKLQLLFARGRVSAGDVRARLMSWAGHARQANSYRLRQRLFRTITFQRAAAVKPCVAGRLVQQ